MSQDSDYYEILGVIPDATTEVIRVAFNSLLKRFPKDTTPEDPVFKQILQAYKVLSSSKRRATYDALMKKAAASLKVDVQASRNSLELSETEQLAYLLIDIHSRAQKLNPQTPLNLSLVIDCSTSMRGERLDKVKAAVNILMSRLTSDNILSVVTFSDRARLVIPAGHVANDIHVTAKINGIQASGGTEIYQGLFAGVEEIRQAPLTNYMNHLILLTDGRTYGDSEKCLQLASAAAEQGIGFSAIGIGTDWNDEFLDKLVAPSSGHTAFIENPEDIIEHLGQQIKGLGQIYAQNIRLSLDFPQDVTVEAGFKLTPYSQPLTIEESQINLGSIEGRAPLSFLLEFRIAPQASPGRINVPLNFLADIPSQEIKNDRVSSQVEFLALKNAPVSAPSPLLVKAVRMLNMYRMSEKVQDDVEAGKTDEAAARMEHLSTRLLEMGQAKLAHQAHNETVRLASMGSVSEEGRKRLKYGTRALLELIDWDSSADD